MKRFVLLFAVFALPLQLHAHKSHRGHDAHQHGAAELSIAFDSAAGKIDFRSPSDSIIGFEHEAKSEADKKKKAEALKKFETNFSEMVVFDKSLNCTLSMDKLEVQAKSAKHSETVAVYSVACVKPLAGTALQFNFQKFFPALKKVSIQILVDALQKNAVAKSVGTRVDLK